MKRRINTKEIPYGKNVFSRLKDYIIICFFMYKRYLLQVKDLLNKEHYFYKMHTIIMKSIIQPSSIDTLYGLSLMFTRKS